MKSAHNPRVLVWMVAFALAWVVLVAYSVRSHDIRWLQITFLVYSVYGIGMQVLGVLARGRTRSVPVPVRLPFVSVLIPARNEARVIADSVRSACAMRYHDREGQPRFEVIVLDDRSGDGTGDVVRRLAPALPVPVRVVRLAADDAHGKAAVLNVGAHAAQGDVLAVLDADSRADPEFLLRAVACLLEPGVAAVQGRRLCQHRAETLAARGQEHEFSVFQTVMQRARDRFGAHVLLNGNGLAVNRRALEAVGGWNPSALTEDIDLAIRFQVVGWKVRYCEEAVVWEESVPDWPGLVRQRTRWAEGVLRALVEHLGAIVSGRMTAFQKTDMLFFLTGSMVVPAAIFASNVYGAVVLLRGVLEPLYLLPMGRSLPPELTAGAFGAFSAALLLSAASQGGWNPLRALRVVVTYLLFTAHQLVATPWAVARYVRSIVTGQVEWLKTDHGMPAPALDPVTPVVDGAGWGEKDARVHERLAMSSLHRTMP
ncbi:MAG: glycosyltransferase family 2 protein [Armatimonadota bacterium]|nr:glycosyltransferase family 2 protein [Armatimonadota bacterium]MDR5697158.1 glycosyltransferase family 2 protein [Armatimonadota bacterium]